MKGEYKMTFQENRRYYSKKWNCGCYIYRQEHNSGECDICGRPCKNPFNLVREDDINECEWTIGTECIKKLQLEES